MDALIERHNCRILGAARIIAEDRSIPVYERIFRTVTAMNIRGESGKEIMEHIHKPQNALMHQKIQKAILCGVTPLLTGIIIEGIEQGLFDTPFPYECMEMVMAYTNTVLDGDMVEMTEEESAARIQALVFNIGRLLGTDSESMEYFSQVFGDQDGGSNE